MDSGPAATAQESVEAAEAVTAPGGSPGTPTAAGDQAVRLRALEARVQAQAAQIEALEQRATNAEAAAGEANEVAAMALEMGGEAAPVDDEIVRFYGFMDMAFKKLYVPNASRFKNLAPDSSTFALGNINFYIDAKPDESLRAMTEVRVTLYPFGSEGDGFERIDTRVYDATSATGRNLVPWSGIVLERAWIEYQAFDALRVRTGYFLTPYGIWNVDHGSPVLISSALPDFWAQEYFPTRQLGVQALGDFHTGPIHAGYRAWIGNGRAHGQIDLDKNKVLGARVFAGLEREVKATLGLSGFWGRDRTFERAIISTDPFRVGRSKTVGYTEYGLAADFALDYEGLRVRAEIVLNDERYDTGYRPMPTPIGYQRDRTRWDTYGIVAYRFGDIEPYVFVDHSRRPALDSDIANLWSAGVIWHFLPPAQFKFQAFYSQFPNTAAFPDAADSSFSGWDMRVVTAF